MLGYLRKGRPSSGLSLALFFICFVTACNLNTDPRGFVRVQPLRILDSILLPEEFCYESLGSAIGNCGDSTLMFLDRSRNIVFWYSYRSMQYTDSLVLDRNLVFEDVCFQSRDTAYVLTDNQRMICIADKQQKIFSLTPHIVRQIDSLHSDEIFPTSISVFKDTIRCFCRAVRQNQDSFPCRADVLRGYDLFFRISGDSLICLGRSNPNPLSTTGQDYGSLLMRSGLQMSGTKIAYTYSFSDSFQMRSYSDSSVNAVKYIRSEFYQPLKAFNYGKVTEDAYISHYEYTQSAFQDLFADANRNFHFQFLKHKSQYITQAGEKLHYYDAPFSLLVFDCQLNQLYEIFIPARRLYPLKKFVTNDGLYVADYKNARKVRGKFWFYRILPAL